MTLIDYRCRVGVAFFGGCGSNVLRRTIEESDPDQFPDFLLFGANTDAKVQQLHFGNNEDKYQRKWIDRSALILHQLGGKEVTGGRGAGAKPEVGRKAAESDKSMEAMRDFFEKADELILLAGAGGGTGTGALPVAARLAVEMNKSTVAIVIMPEPEEGRSRRAIAALKEVQELVPTIPISNAYLQEYMKHMPKEVRAKLTYKDAWDIVNQHSIVPLVRILREIIQETGDIINIDEADWRNMLSYGHHVFFGLAEIATLEHVWEKPAEEIVKELFAARFQDAGAIERGKIIGLWGHGPWPKELFGEIEKQVKHRVSAGNLRQGEEGEIEVIKGILHEVSDGKMWIALIIVSDIFDSQAIPVEVRSENARPVLHSVAADWSQSEKAKISIRFRSQGEWHERSVSRDLASLFNRSYSNVHTTREEMEKLRYEVERETGLLPDMPERFRNTKDRTA